MLIERNQTGIETETVTLRSFKQTPEVATFASIYLGLDFKVRGLDHLDKQLV